MGGVKQEQSDGPGPKGFHHSDSTHEDVRILTGHKLLCTLIISNCFIYLILIIITITTCPAQQFTQHTACKEAWLAQR